MWHHINGRILLEESVIRAVVHGLHECYILAEEVPGSVRKARLSLLDLAHQKGQSPISITMHGVNLLQYIGDAADAHHIIIIIIIIIIMLADGLKKKNVLYAIYYAYFL